MKAFPQSAESTFVVYLRNIFTREQLTRRYFRPDYHAEKLSRIKQ